MSDDLKIGDWYVRPALHRIEREQDHRRVSPKAMKVLELLAATPGMVVDKEHIIAAVWDGFPSDEAIATVVYELRKAFDDDARQPKVIETIRKRGFRLVAEVEKVGINSTAASPAARLRPRLLALALSGGLVIAGVLVSRSVDSSKQPQAIPVGESSISSVAVLPFTTLTSYDEDLLAAALSEMLISDLARTCSAEISPAIAIRERTTWLLDDAVRELGADAVVEGSVLQSGNRVWISVQLVETSTGKLLWSTSYDRVLGDELAVLREVALEVAQQIQEQIELPALIDGESAAEPFATSLPSLRPLPDPP